MRIVSIIVLIAFSMMIFGCGGKARPRTAGRGTGVEDNRNYHVEFENGQHYKVKGSDLDVRGNQVGIRLENTSEYRYYDRSQIKEITTRDKKKWPIAVGAVTGAVVLGGLGAGLWYGLHEPDPSAHRDCDDAGDCAGMAHFAGGIGIGIAGVAVGAGIGAVIGNALRKKHNILVAPQVYKNGGGGVGVSGRF